MRASLFRVSAAVAIALTSVSIILTTHADEASPQDKWQAPARAARKKNPVAADDASLSAGKVLYGQECRACHGDLGKGDGPSAKDLERKPGDLSSPQTATQTDGELFWKLTEGKKPMPSYAQKFTDEQRWTVVNYVRTLAPKQENK